MKTHFDPYADDEYRYNDKGEILCDFCDNAAVYTNCRFWPPCDTDGLGCHWSLCGHHFKQQDNEYGSTGEEKLIKTEL